MGVSYAPETVSLSVFSFRVIFSGSSPADAGFSGCFRYCLHVLGRHGPFPEAGADPVVDKRQGLPPLPLSGKTHDGGTGGGAGHPTRFGVRFGSLEWDPYVDGAFA